MTHLSRTFGPFEYNEKQVITFPEGLLGLEKFKKYVLKSSKKTDPVVWLLSIEEGGPELALIDPRQVGEEFSLDGFEIESRILGMLSCTEEKRLSRYAVVTLPENLKRISMDLRAPILIDPKSRKAIQYTGKALEKKPVRTYIYRELILSRPEDKIGGLIMHRRQGETVEIGDEITIQVMEFANGGVRLGIYAPRSMPVRRGEGKVSSEEETRRASEEMDLKRLEGIMKMHKLMQEPDDAMADAVQLRSTLHAV